MTWRIHFTAEDLARTTVGETLGPLAETMFGVSLLSCPPQHPPGLAGWRERARARLTPEMSPLASLVPRGSWGVDLWTLTGEAPTIQQGIEALRAMPRDLVLGELEFFAQHHNPLPATVWKVAEPGSEARERLVRAAYASYRALIEPHWTQVQARLRAERVRRARALVNHGTERLLSTLFPARIRWRPPVLEILMPGETDLYLAGRGLVLVPSLFVGELPSLMSDLRDEAPAKLFFPVDLGDMPGARLLRGSPPSQQTLGALMGPARASALRRVADGCTTAELAEHLSVSVAAAGQHATVLRDSGLITTRRRDGIAWHSLTPLGVALLEAA